MRKIEEFIHFLLNKPVNKNIIKDVYFFLSLIIWLGFPYIIIKGGYDAWLAGFLVSWFILFIVFCTYLENRY